MRTPPHKDDELEAVFGTQSTRPLPQEATRARPGTEEKILVLQGRAERGEQLYHPNDATHETGTGYVRANQADGGENTDGQVDMSRPYKFLHGIHRTGRLRRRRRTLNRFTDVLAVDEE